LISNLLAAPDEVTMNPALTTCIAINNFLHDLASGIPLASGVAMWVVVSQYEKNGNNETGMLMLRLYQGISRIFLVSLVLITLGAIPRILTFTKFESANALSNHNVTGLIAVHVTIFAAVMGGTFLWIALTRKVKRLRGSL
jgi:hypothetical protein